MSQSNAAEANNPVVESNDEHEIDKIMKEIEALEKKVEEPSSSKEISEAKADSDLTKSGPNKEAPMPDNVIPFRENTSASSLVETDATPVSQESLMKKSPFETAFAGTETGTDSQGTLALKIGGCTTVNLEFAHAGLTVSFECTDSGLTIRTDQGAEFRVPFTNKQAA